MIEKTGNNGHSQIRGCSLLSAKLGEIKMIGRNTQRTLDYYKVPIKAIDDAFEKAGFNKFGHDCAVSISDEGWITYRSYDVNWAFKGNRFVFEVIDQNWYEKTQVEFSQEFHFCDGDDNTHEQRKRFAGKWFAHVCTHYGNNGHAEYYELNEAVELIIKRLHVIIEKHFK